MNPQGNEWNLLNLQDMKVAVQAKVSMEINGKTCEAEGKAKVV